MIITAKLQRMRAFDSLKVARKHADALRRGKVEKVHRFKRPVLELRLLVAGKTPTSIRAFEKQLCEEPMHGAYKIQVVDVLEQPKLATGDQIIAVPTLVRRLTTPVKKIIGDFSNTERVLVDLRPAGGRR